MSINKFATDFILEIQRGEKSEGILCCERVIVKVMDEGAGAFLAIKADNLEPTDDYDSHTITLTLKDVKELCTSLEDILNGFEEVSE